MEACNGPLRGPTGLWPQEDVITPAPLAVLYYTGNTRGIRLIRRLALRAVPLCREAAEGDGGRVGLKAVSANLFF